MIVFGREKGFKLFGKEPAGLRMEYIWASHLPKGHLFDHPGEKDCKILVLESGGGKVGQWVHESRNLHKDFKEAFKMDPPGITAIGIHDRHRPQQRKRHCLLLRTCLEEKVSIRPQALPSPCRRSFSTRFGSGMNRERTNPLALRK